MNLRERLVRLKDDGRLVGLSFAGPSGNHLARLLRVGIDYIEFESCEPNGTVLAHLVVPMQLLAGITVTSVARQRAELEAMLRREGGEASS